MTGTTDARQPVRQRMPVAARGGWLLVCAVVILAAPVSASELNVKAAAAEKGDLGLEVETSIGCAQANVVVPAGPVISDYAACAKLRTANPGPVEVLIPGVDFEAGEEIKLDTGLRVEADMFSAKIHPFIDSRFAYVADGTPEARKDYAAWFSIDLDPFALALGEDIGIFVGYDAAEVRQFRLLLRRYPSAPEVRLVVEGRDNTVGDLVEYPEQFEVQGGFNRISLWWRALDDHGQVLVSVNHSPLAGLTDLDNATSRIDQVRLGVVDGSPSSTSGAFYLDDFSSFRTLAP